MLSEIRTKLLQHGYPASWPSALREDLIETILRLGMVGRSDGFGDGSVGMVTRQIGKIIW